jgi:hypothetical protein
MMKDFLKQNKFITKELPTKEFAIAISWERERQRRDN